MDAVGVMNEQVVETLAGLTPDAEAQVARRLNLLLGAVLLAEMTQGETDRLFEQKVKLAGE